MSRFAVLLVFAFAVCMVSAFPLQKDLIKRILEEHKKRGNDETWEDYTTSCEGLLQFLCKDEELAKLDGFEYCSVPGGRQGLCREGKEECEEDGHEAWQCLGYHLGKGYCKVAHDDPKGCAEAVDDCAHEKIPWEMCLGYHIGLHYCDTSYVDETTCPAPKATEECVAECEGGVRVCARGSIPLDQCKDYAGTTLGDCGTKGISTKSCPGYHFGIQYCNNSFVAEHGCEEADPATCVSQCKAGVTECSQEEIPMDICGEYHGAKHYCKNSYAADYKCEADPATCESQCEAGVKECAKAGIPFAQCIEYHGAKEYCMNNFKLEHGCEEKETGECEKECLGGVKECIKHGVALESCGEYHMVAKYYCSTEYAIKECVEDAYKCLFTFPQDAGCFDEMKSCMREKTKECERGAHECYGNGVKIEKCGHYHEVKNFLYITIEGSRALEICKKYKIPDEYCVQSIATCAVTEGIHSAKDCEEHHIQQGNIPDTSGQIAVQSGQDSGQISRGYEKEKKELMDKLKRYLETGQLSKTESKEKLRRLFRTRK